VNRWPAPEPPSRPRRADRLLVLAARKRGRVERDALLRVACPGCLAELGAVLLSGQIWCPTCGVWAGADDGPATPEAT